MTFPQCLVIVIPLCWAIATVFTCLLFRARGRYNSKLK